MLFQTKSGDTLKSMRAVIFVVYLELLSSIKNNNKYALLINTGRMTLQAVNDEQYSVVFSLNQSEMSRSTDSKRRSSATDERQC